MNNRRALGILFILTIIAAVLRFAALDRPSLWGDEAWTFSRVCGSYKEMLDLVSFAGFAPLHYELYWWIGHHLAKLTPIVMRLVPAIAGTLMVPAVYFLARQLVSVRTALVAALFATVSAYLLVYSRDAKMYMHFWLMCTLSMGCFLWWLNELTIHPFSRGARPAREVDETDRVTSESNVPSWASPAAKLDYQPRGRRWRDRLRNSTQARIRFWCWIAASIAMVGLHAPGAMILGIEALIFLSHRGLHWKRAIAFALGVAIILAGIGTYYLRFSRLKDRVLVQKNTSASQPSYDIHLGNTGIFWVPRYNSGRTTPELFLYATTAFLLSWEYPMAGQVPSIPPRTYKILVGATRVLIALIVLGVFPWRRTCEKRVGSLFESAEKAGREKGVGSLFVQEKIGGTSVRNLFQKRLPTPFLEGDVAVEWWRALLWIGCWIVLPAYAFYCVTVANFLTPLDWLRFFGAQQGLVALTGLLLALICVFACGSNWRERATKAGLLAISLTVLWLLCGAVAIVIQRMRWSENVWLPRYLGVIWPAFAIALATLFMRLPMRPLRVFAIACFVAINLLQYSWRVFGESEPPTALLARDLVDSQPKDSTTRTYTKLSRLPGVEPGEGVVGSAAFRYYLAASSSIPVAPSEFQIGPNWRNAEVRKYEDRFQFRPPMQNPIMLRFTDFSTWIPNELKASPKVKRVVVWELFETKDRDLAGQDRLQAHLPGWRRASQDVYTAYDHWRWRALYLSRRSVYERK